MTPTKVAVIVLLTVGVSVELVCCIGVLVARDPLDRLHFVSPAGIIGGVPLLAAAMLEASSWSHTARTFVVAIVLVFASPFVNRAIARGLHIREVGEFRFDAMDARLTGSEGDAP